ncbi:MAG: hypothetical protein GXZ04_08300 [Clostridiales bacterium]|nr:hypothetical protein [Clostridiales bacterium]
MKKVSLILLLVLTVVLLAGCQPQKDALPAEQPGVEEQPAGSQQSPLDLVGQTEVEGLPEGYDPSEEESEGLPIVEGEFSKEGIAMHAGATAIPLDPVDMPSPTKRPDLTFTFASYTASKLGITFESVAGYIVDDSQADVYVLTEPIEQQKDNYSVVFTFSKSAVNTGYTLNNLKADLKTFAADLGKVNYQKWSVSNIAERTLLGKPGCYVTYRGVQYDGTIVRGRVHMAILDNNRVLAIHYTGPGEYNMDYSNNVFTRIRSTLKTL